MSVFKLELDLVLFFCPPMKPLGPGIVLSRTLILPFPPYNGLAIHSKGIDETPGPLGFALKGVVWDIDREVFLAKTTSEFYGPMGLIADEIRNWIEQGWRLGSYNDQYQSDDAADDCEETPDELANAIPDEAVMELWEQSGTRNRPKEFNKLFRAMVRKMVELLNDCSVAYAMWKTQRYFHEDELENPTSPQAEKFKNAIYEYSQMSFDKQTEWMERVTKSYPRLERLIS